LPLWVVQFWENSDWQTRNMERMKYSFIGSDFIATEYKKISNKSKNGATGDN
jgi:hypothetical protein